MHVGQHPRGDGGVISFNLIESYNLLSLPEASLQVAQQVEVYTSSPVSAAVQVAWDTKELVRKTE